MLFFLINTIAVAYASTASLPRLIMSARVSRGYAYEDRVTRIKKIDAAVDSIPHLGEVLPVVMKTTMIGYGDIA